MPEWNVAYVRDLRDRFAALVEGLDDRLEDVVQGRVIPDVENIPIASARAVRAAVLFFDIEDFTSRVPDADDLTLKRALFMLDCVIPMVMHVVHDHDGYVEKNTGDGVMAVFMADSDDESANAALDAAVVIFYMLRNLINPTLEYVGIAGVHARIGIDLGSLLLARIGVPRGRARTDRSFLTAIGPASILAIRMQSMADTDQIVVGDLLKQSARANRQQFFLPHIPDGEWKWTYSTPPHQRYWLWRYAAERKPIALG
jgi:adenylate cyclase